MKHPKLALLVSALVILYVGLNMWIYLYGAGAFGGILGNLLKSVSVVKTQQTSFGLLNPSPTPLPPKILPTGDQTYTFSHGPDVVGPKLHTVIVAPIDPAVGAMQTITATITHTSPVTTVTGYLYTDKGVTEHPFKMISGTATDGTWSSSWFMPSTYLQIYYLNFSIKSTTTSWDGGLRFR